MRRRLRAVLATALVATAALAAPSHAFAPGRASGASGADELALVLADGAPPRSQRSVERASGAALPAGWRAIRDRETGVVLRLWGGSVPAPGAVRDPAIAERAARDFVAAQIDLLAPGARVDEFVTAANRLDGTLRTVVLRQTWRGLRVVGGYVHVVFANDRLFVAGSEALPHVQPAGEPRIAAPAARRDLVEAWLARETRRGETRRGELSLRPTGERVVLPIVRGPGQLEYRIADVLDARAGATGRWDVYAAPDGAPIARASRARAAASTLALDVPVRYPGGERIAMPAARAAVIVDGAAGATGDDGGFTWPGEAPAAVVPSASGAQVRVTNNAGAPATAALTAQPGQPVVWSLAGDEFGDAQLVAYAYGMLAKAHGRRMQPGLAWLDQPLSITVNNASTCNAISTGDAVHFYRADAECQNTARLADIVLHEVGHSYHYQTSMFDMAAIDLALAEGVADFFAANITGDPAIGRGFRYTAAPVRDLDPPGFERVYPADVTASQHATGQIIGGALWDLRRGLIARLGEAEGRAVAERIFVGVLLRASDLPSSYVAALTADDDDGDLGNGTPHGCELELAFGRHGLAGPEFRTTTLGAPVVDGLAIAVPVEVPVDRPAGPACQPPRVTAMTLTWRIGDGAPADVAMTEDAGGVWRGAIPPQPAGTVVAYQIAAAFDDGQRTILPDNPADRWYQLFAGDAAPIWCERFDADPRWPITGANEWTWGAPMGGAGDPRAAFSGAAVLGNDVSADGAYRRSLDTRIEAPPVDGSMYERVHLQFRRWLTVEDAAYDQATIAIGGAPIWTNASDPDGNATLDHVDKEWRFVDLDVTPQIGSAMTVSWGLVSDGSNQRGGWNLDDVCLVGLGKLPRCGDAIVDDGEACDDGNTEDGDGCSSSCGDEPGGCCDAGGDPRGPLALAICVGLGLFAPRARRRRRV